MQNRDFERKIYQKMLQWKREKDGHTALLIKGARRIGKSTVAEMFAKREYESYLLIDFAFASKEVLELFENVADLDSFFMGLQLHYNVRLTPRKSVIIFDEVQLCPKARQAIKLLVKDHRFDYIETGSLLSIKKNVKDILIPSEETRLTMYPMDYEEFLAALGNTVTVQFLKEAFENKTPFKGAHRRLMQDFRLYMAVGGMPQAVNEYLETKDLSRVDGVKREILELYMDDFRKIDPSGKAGKLLKSIPAQLSKNTNRYKVSSVIKGATTDRLADILADMEDSLVVNFAHHSDDPNVGLALNMDSSQFKMFLCDTGLFVTLAFWDKDFTDNIIYKKLVNDKLKVNLGYVYENAVAQILRTNGNELFFHTFPTESGKHNYEIDFLLSKGNKLCPIEVKSSGYKTHTSLDAFCKKYSSRIADRYLIYSKDLAKEEQTSFLPIYMAVCL